MVSYLIIGLGSLFLYWFCKKALSLNRNIAIAKAAGIPYRVSLIDGIPGYLWIAAHDVFLGPLNSFTPSQNWLWPKSVLLHPHRGWFYAQELRESLGEVYLIVSPNQIFLSSSSAEATSQITSRRHDFVKPVEIYAIVDIFGPSILTTEGIEWKRHRKIVAPAFSEKSNALVWKESLRQTLGMLKSWSKLENNCSDDMKVEDTAPSTAMMTLHVICAAGFGVPQLWDGEDEVKLGKNVVPGFNTTKLNGSHQLTFKHALNTLLGGIMWLAIFPVGLLKKSPFKVHKRVLRAYFECGDYFGELAEDKSQKIELGEDPEAGVMDVMGPLVKASANSPEESKDCYLTKQEVISNSWITLFAGHETSANITHYCLLFLAIEQDQQADLQQDIDRIVGSRPSPEWTYETDFPRLWNSMIGATINETLRLMPPVIDIPKIVREIPQDLTYDEKQATVPAGTIIHLSAVGVHRNPRYWPHAPSKLTSKAHDLDDFVPGRWLASRVSTDPKPSPSPLISKASDPKTTRMNTNHCSPLFTPPKGAYMPFSLSSRSCPGKRFAEIEITATLAAIFQTYTLELDVRDWASDVQIAEMDEEEREMVYERARERARKMIFGSRSEIFLKMRGSVGVRFLRRGGERFRGI
ncbi:cytochrome P450 monooxygenase-like protein [Leptodontidium sp. MPI-SDFR-AT-0119]|nr:cytochrome P450 monooxygenase-like protein [Leptodontidium sp. MPI-SDFR-AT-0119]